MMNDKSPFVIIFTEAENWVDYPYTTSGNILSQDCLGVEFMILGAGASTRCI